MPHVSLKLCGRAGKFVLCPAVLVLLTAALLFRPTESAHGRASAPVSLTGAAARAYLEGQGLDARLAQRTKLTVTDGAANDQFGSAVAVSGDTAVVGAPGADGPVRSETQGPIADQGAAYTFGCGFVEQQMFSPRAASPGDQIGLAVAVDGDTAVVGAPGLFTANANGQGVAAALALPVKADGAQSFEPVAQFDAGQNRFVAAAVDLGPESDQVFLVLYGTGIRLRSALSGVSATIGGLGSEVLFADAAPGFVGLDQVNVRLSRALAGRGEVDVLLSVDGRAANPVRVSIR